MKAIALSVIGLWTLISLEPELVKIALSMFELFQVRGLIDQLLVVVSHVFEDNDDQKLSAADAEEAVKVQSADKTALPRAKQLRVDL